MSSNKKGFTLIELLVVVAIIGVLSSVVLTSLNSAREKGRDSRRMRDIEEIRNAIELYILANGKAPDFDGSGVCSNPQGGEMSCCAMDYAGGCPYTWVQLQTQLSPYIKILPKDPCGAACFNKRVQSNNNLGYFTYHYSAPSNLGMIFSNITSTHYQIYAQNLESKTASFGYKSF